MKFKLKYLCFFIFLFSCTQDLKNINKKNLIKDKAFSSKGFALIYSESDYDKKILSKKLINTQNYVLHNILRDNRRINITNPINSKSLNASVINTENYPSIYNIVITKKMAEELDLDINNPYVEILAFRINDKFIAKEASIFDEEKNVADKAPVTAINIKDLSSSKSITNNKVKKTPSYIINIADFYYLESAELLKNRFKKEKNLINIKIKKISQNKFKLYSGPYDSFGSMRRTYTIIAELGFEDLEVRNVNK